MVVILVLVNYYPHLETFVFQDGNFISTTFSALPIVQNIGTKVDGSFLQLANANVICWLEISLGILFVFLLFLSKKLLFKNIGK